MNTVQDLLNVQSAFAASPLKSTLTSKTQPGQDWSKVTVTLEDETGEIRDTRNLDLSLDTVMTAMEENWFDHSRDL